MKQIIVALILLVALCAVTAAVGYHVGLLEGFAEGHKLRECPTRLADGRTLRSRNLDTNECSYAPAPRSQLDWYTPTELRRLARQREIQERIKHLKEKTP